MKTILGTSPITTIVGFLLAGLTAAQTLLSQGNTNWYQIGVAALMAILGRVAADANTGTSK
jgi:hypothetical protein